MISYKPLSIILAKKELKKLELIELCKISSSTLAKLGKNESASLNVIEKCRALECKIEDVVEIIND